MREENDPIEQVKNRLLADGVATQEDLKHMDKEVRAICAEAAEFAKTAPEPDKAELFTDIMI
jgi:pyruvate dehydrogenase E1 component alpha subunit